VLSLFFIDRVANYAPEDGLIRTLFNRAFEEHRQHFPEWNDLSVELVQAAYFAEQRRRSGRVDLMDSVSGEAKQDEAAYDLIMRDKERLLSFEEPVSFIFSHSALREGWDNPNVFQICTLNQTSSDVKKRQEVGRGVRLARDQDGNRVHDDRLNVLTVVANQSYESYVAQLQAETELEYGKEGNAPKPANARERGVAKLRKAHTLAPEFKDLWEQISRRTRYAVTIDTERLISEVLPGIDAIKVRTPRVAVTKAQVQVGSANTFEALQVSAAKTVASLSGRYPLPNLVEIMANLMEATTPPVRLTRRTLLELFQRTSNQAAALDNPHEFATEAVRAIKERLADHLVAGIRYEKINDQYEMTQLQVEIESWKQFMVPAKRSVYDHVIYDSQVEKDFVEGLEKRDDVKLYLKLPNWFTVPTPIGDYNPDWALVMEDRDEHGAPTGRPLLYLVRETKDENFRKNPRPSERRKITCAEQHFGKALDVSYRVVTFASELP
jgi:type III restriction enzyme